MSASTVAGSQTASFSLIDVDIKQAALALQHHSGLPVMLEHKVAGKISLVSKRPLDGPGAVTLLAAVAREKGWYPEIGVQGNLTIRATPLPIGDLVSGSIVTRKYPTLYRTATEASPHLRKLLSPRGSISAVDDRALLIHDEQRVHNRILQALIEIDVESVAGALYAKLQFAQASDVADALHRLAALISEPRLAIVQANMSSNSLIWQSSEPLWDERLRNMIASFEQDAKLVAALGATPLPPPIKSTVDTQASKDKVPHEPPAMHVTILPPAVQPENNAVPVSQGVGLATADWPNKGATTDLIRQGAPLNSTHLIELHPSQPGLIIDASLESDSSAPLWQGKVQKGKSTQPPVSSIFHHELTQTRCDRGASDSGSNAEGTECLSLKLTRQLSGAL